MGGGLAAAAASAVLAGLTPLLVIACIRWAEDPGDEGGGR